MRYMLIASNPQVASKYKFPEVKHAAIPDFAKHLIQSANDQDDKDNILLECDTHYSNDLSGRFWLKLHKMCGQIEKMTSNDLV